MLHYQVGAGYEDLLLIVVRHLQVIFGGLVVVLIGFLVIVVVSVEHGESDFLLHLFLQAEVLAEEEVVGLELAVHEVGASLENVLPLVEEHLVLVCVVLRLHDYLEGGGDLELVEGLD